ncbi:MAG: efflux RND transporter periplasmic adaptor subunit [Muribaculum sp.]|nr:efflux RND transporter periplasmic adaptor subunit [Muribaculum sp.]
MKYINIAVAAVLSTGLCLIFPACSHDGHDHHEHKEHHHDHDADHDHEEEAVAHDHSDEIILSPEAAEKFGVKTSVVELQPFSEVVKVTGKLMMNPSNVTDAVAKSSGIVKYVDGVVPGMKVYSGQTIATISASGMAGGDQNAVSAAELNAARRELERLQPLYEDGVVSLKDLNAAKAAYERALSSSSGRQSGSTVTALRSGVLTELLATQGGFVEQGAPVARISSGSDMVLRADLPQKYVSLSSQFIDANFRTVASDSIFMLADFSGHRIAAPAVASSSIPGYVPVYFSLDGEGKLMPDAYVEVYLKGNTRNDVISVPRNAVSEQQGQHFVFIRIDDHGYEKRPVKLGQTDGRYVEVLSGLNSGDNVVTEGAIFVRLAQSGNVIPEGHSHNH